MKTPCCSILIEWKRLNKLVFYTNFFNLSSRLTRSNEMQRSIVCSGLLTSLFNQYRLLNAGNTPYK